jgi:hypothetical protein
MVLHPSLVTPGCSARYNLLYGHHLLSNKDLKTGRKCQKPQRGFQTITNSFHSMLQKLIVDIHFEIKL